MGPGWQLAEWPSIPADQARTSEGRTTATIVVRPRPATRLKPKELWRFPRAPPTRQIEGHAAAIDRRLSIGGLRLQDLTRQAGDQQARYGACHDDRHTRASRSRGDRPIPADLCPASELSPKDFAVGIDSGSHLQGPVQRSPQYPAGYFAAAGPRGRRGRFARQAEPEDAARP